MEYVTPPPPWEAGRQGTLNALEAQFRSTSTSPVVRGHRRNLHALDGIITALRTAGYEFVIPKS